MNKQITMKTHKYIMIILAAGLQQFASAKVDAEIAGPDKFKSNRYGEYNIALSRNPDKGSTSSASTTYDWQSEGRVTLTSEESTCYVIPGKRSTTSTRYGSISCSGQYKGESYNANAVKFTILPVFEGIEHNP